MFPTWVKVLLPRRLPFSISCSCQHSIFFEKTKDRVTCMLKTLVSSFAAALPFVPCPSCCMIRFDSIRSTDPSKLSFEIICQPAGEVAHAEPAQGGEPGSQVPTHPPVPHHGHERGRLSSRLQVSFFFFSSYAVASTTFR